MVVIGKRLGKNCIAAVYTHLTAEERLDAVLPVRSASVEVFSVS
jgi:hypothetical protein